MIICCGEALIDMLPRELPNGDSVLLPVPGGAVFNTAIGLGRLGEKTAFVSGLSQDMFGDQLVATLEESNVSTEFVARLDKPATLAFVKLVDGQATYSFYDENSANRSLTLSDVPALGDAVEALHFGAISLIPEPCGSTYEALMAENEKSVLSLDPNIRPGFIKDAASHRARLDRMIAMSDCVKVSDEDLDWMTDGKDGEAVMQSWLASGPANGPSVVLMTRGGDGATAYTRSGSIDVAAPKVTVVDTIGAGDTFNAGWLSGLRDSNLLTKAALANAKPEDLKPALEKAITVAAHVVSVAGANPPWAKDL